jgi:hypothetical protein
MLSEAKHLGYELKKEILHFVQNDNQFILLESLRIIGCRFTYRETI